MSIIRQKLDRLNDAFLYEKTIDIEIYDRQRDRLCEEQTLLQMDRHSTQLEEIDVEGILASQSAFCRVPRTWVQASLDQKQRLQQLFFPEGIAFDGNGFNRTAATAPLFKYLEPTETADEGWWT